MGGGAALKYRIFELFEQVGFNSAFRRRTQHFLKILMYHGVMKAPATEAAYGSLHVGLAEFSAHLAHLSAHYRVIPLLEAVQYLRADKSLPANAVALTFDDGYANTLETAAPVLQAHGFLATFYVCTGLVGAGEFLWYDRLRSAVFSRYGSTSEGETAYRSLVAQLGALPTKLASSRTDEICAEMGLPEHGFAERLSGLRLLTWDELSRLTALGHTVGSHTRTHAILTRVDRPTALAEVSGSFRDLASRLGTAPETFAFPDGQFTGDLLSLVRSAGYRCATTTLERFNPPGGDPFQIGRLTVSDRGNLAIFKARLSGSLLFVKRLRPLLSKSAIPPAP